MQGSGVFKTASKIPRDRHRCFNRIHTGSNKLHLRGLNLNSSPSNLNICVELALILFPQICQVFLQIIFGIIHDQNGKLKAYILFRNRAMHIQAVMGLAYLERFKRKSIRRTSNKWTKTLCQDYLHCIANFYATVLNILSKVIISNNNK